MTDGKIDRDMLIDMYDFSPRKYLVAIELLSTDRLSVLNHVRYLFLRTKVRHIADPSMVIRRVLYHRATNDITGAQVED